MRLRRSLALAGLALLAGGCVNGVRSGKPVAPAVGPPSVASPAPAPLPPPPPAFPTPPAAPTVWRAEYYTISDG